MCGGLLAYLPPVLPAATVDPPQESAKQDSAHDESGEASGATAEDASKDATESDAPPTEENDEADKSDETKHDAAEAETADADSDEAESQDLENGNTEAGDDESADATPSETEPSIKPRFALYIPSVHGLAGDAKRSHAAVFTPNIVGLVKDVMTSSAEGVDPDAIVELIDKIRQWPDTSIDAATYAPDTEGRMRWSVTLSWPLAQTVDGLGALLKTDAAADLLENVTVETDEDAEVGERYVIRVPDSEIAYVFAASDGRCCIASHPDVPLADKPFRGADDLSIDECTNAVVCRLNMAGTEQDSGGGMFSKFSVVTAIDYAGGVDESGDWRERMQIRWPPVSGMAIKALFGRVKDTFFVPGDAFGAMVFDSDMAPGVLEQMAGFGPQITFDPSGEMEVIGEDLIGPLATHMRSEMSVTILPGTGFLPAPDIVVQSRGKNVDEFPASIRNAIKKINESYVKKEQKPPWCEESVRDRAVFWNKGTSSGSVMMPFAMRPVLFVSKEKDAAGKDREMVCVGWTTTSPEGLVRRWLDMPRRDEPHYIPDARKTNGQAWVQVKEMYEWLHPYMNLGISAKSLNAILPPTKRIEEHLTDALATVTVTYSGLMLDHRGPAPMGLVAMPTMLGASLEEHSAGSSDLARERLASQRLKVLFHHSKLFKKDIGRWPVEVAELDGYVDFAGNPYLLRLQVSRSASLSKWFEEMAKEADNSDDDDADDDEQGRLVDPYADIKDDIYVIEWGKDHWTLGIAQGTLDHLDKLYIDQDGEIHRVVKDESDKESKDKKAEQAAKPESTPARIAG